MKRINTIEAVRAYLDLPALLNELTDLNLAFMLTDIQILIMGFHVQNWCAKVDGFIAGLSESEAMTVNWEPELIECEKLIAIVLLKLDK